MAAYPEALESDIFGPRVDRVLKAGGLGLRVSGCSDHVKEKQKPPQHVASSLHSGPFFEYPQTPTPQRQGNFMMGARPPKGPSWPSCKEPVMCACFEHHGLGGDCFDVFDVDVQGLGLGSLGLRV